MRVVETDFHVLTEVETKFDVVVTLADGRRITLGVFREALPGVLWAIRSRAGLPQATERA